MTVFEFCSAILTTFRSVQAFRVSGPWKTQKGGFLYLVFEQGVFIPILLQLAQRLKHFLQVFSIFCTHSP